ncbi:hypothetical protein ACFCXR_22645 [Streptomyces noursei]|uniref:hypothetical protein n=1 Tax=Streptomyces TaxID=1883 RepID=UPI0035E21F01
MPNSRRSLSRAITALRSWQSRQRIVAAGGALTTTLAVGVPTAVVPTPLFARTVPVQWWNYPTLAVTAVLAGIVLSTYVRLGTAESQPRKDREKRLGAIGGVLSFLAVGCPICNKLVLILLGTSGALSYWAPLQPLLALVSIGLLMEAALSRLSMQTQCPLQARR